jgi:hypothetical protein
MDWACNCFEAGFDFNPKSKTCLGNLKWMYDSLHNAQQMLPNVISIQLPDPLPDTKSMDDICYDFVPQLLSILQNKEMMSANNLVLDPITLWLCTSHKRAGLAKHSQALFIRICNSILCQIRQNNFCVV